MVEKKNNDEKKDAAAKWVFFRSIAAGLRAQPAYLLIFGIAALFFLVALGSGIAGAINNNPRTLVLAFGSLLASLTAAVIVILRVEQSSAPPEQTPERPHNLRGGDGTFDDVLYAIHGGVFQALRFKNETFREAVLEECQAFRARVADWSEGRFVAHEHYNRLLLTLYERAKESVFSTSIPNYLPTWSTPFAAQLMDAHKRSPATVTRVFVFNKLQDVTAEAVEAMKKQVKSDIKVRVFFSDGNGLFAFPADVSRDFTVIDHGEAIGITVAYGDSLAAEWYIQDDDRKRRFEALCAGLIRGSESFSAFSARWQKVD